MTKTPKTVVKPARLTNDMRSTFIAAVMADVPKAEFEDSIRDSVNKAHAAALPPQIKKVLADPMLAPFINIGSETLNHRDGLPYDKFISFRLASAGERWLETLVADAAAPHLKAWIAQEENQKALRSKLKVVADSCTTTTALAEAFPEFARYLPQTPAEGTRNLPALANVVSDFVKAGWPKTKKEAKK